MRTSVILLSISTLLFSCHGATQNPPVFPAGVKAKNVHHSGDVWLNYLSRADEYYDFNIVVAKFAPGARLNWHSHPAGQHLIITEGVGYYQERNTPVRIVRKGETIKCTPGAAHWHAAAPNLGVTYLAITGNKATEWLEPVSNKVYENVPLSNAQNGITKLSTAE